MTGEEHYREAEALLNDTGDGSVPPEVWVSVRMLVLAEAQVHATLALAYRAIHTPITGPR